MNKEFYWVEQYYKAYKRQFTREPFFLSDWDIEPERVLFPKTIINEASSRALNNSHKYLFSEDLHDLKEQLSTTITEDETVKIQPNQIGIFSNPTNALYLTINALVKKGIKRYLIVTPAYYTVEEALFKLHVDVTYFHLSNQNGYLFEVDKFTELCCTQNIEAVIITDPVYSSGVPIEGDIIDKVTGFCKNKSIWLVFDNSLDGLAWDSDRIRHIDKEKLEKISQANKFIVISSITKSLFLNSSKSALIISNPEIIHICDDLACSISGGLSSLQVNILSNIISPINDEYIANISSSNTKLIKQNFSILKSAFIGSDWHLPKTSVGYFTILTHNNKSIGDVDSAKYFEKLLFEDHIRALPLDYFGHYRLNNFGVRVNLLKNIKEVLPSLIRCIDKHLD